MSWQSLNLLICLGFYLTFWGLRRKCRGNNPTKWTQVLRSQVIQCSTTALLVVYYRKNWCWSFGEFFFKITIIVRNYTPFSAYTCNHGKSHNRSLSQYHFFLPFLHLPPSNSGLPVSHGYPVKAIRKLGDTWVCWLLYSVHFFWKHPLHLISSEQGQATF